MTKHHPAYVSSDQNRQRSAQAPPSNSGSSGRNRRSNKGHTGNRRWFGGGAGGSGGPPRPPRPPGPLTPSSNTSTTTTTTSMTFPTETGWYWSCVRIQHTSVSPYLLNITQCRCGAGPLWSCDYHLYDDYSEECGHRPCSSCMVVKGLW